MDDASGHYTSGYYWGNNYWTGSMSLCRRIFKHDEDDHYMKRKQTTNVGLSFNENTASVQIDHENPPFVPRFAVLKIVFKEAHTTPIVRFNLHFAHILMIYITIFAASNTSYRCLFAILM